MSREYLFLSPNDLYTSNVRAFVLKGSQAVRRGQRKTQHKSLTRQKPDLRSKSTQSDAEVPATSDSMAIVQFTASHLNTPSQDLVLGMNRVDPFQTMALATNRREQICLDHFANDSVAEYGRLRSDSFFPPRLTLRHLLVDDLGLRMCIYYGACSLAHYYPGNIKLRNIANYFRVEALRHLRNRIVEEFAVPSDSLIHSVIGFLAVTLQVHQQKANEEELTATMIHIQGLRSLLARREGWNPVVYNEPLQWDLYWHDIICKGAISAHHTNFSTHIQTKAIKTSNLTLLRALCGNWAANCAVEFVNAYRDFYDANLSRLRNRQEKSNPDPMQLFAPDTRAYQILKHHTGYAFQSIVPILYLNIMWWNQRYYAPDYLTDQHNILRANMRRCDVDIASGVEFLMCAIANDLEKGTWKQPEWMHLLCRMLSVESKLEEDTRAYLKSCLLDFVTANDEQTCASWWRPDHVEQRVFSELTDRAQQEHGTVVAT